MSTVDTSTELVRSYLDAWRNGAERYDADALRRLLAPDLDFEGPLAGHRVGAEGFIAGLRGFATLLREVHMLREVSCGDEHALLYACETVKGAELRIAEFITVRDGLIRAIKIVYDKGDFAALS